MNGMQKAGMRGEDRRFRRVSASFCWVAAAILCLPGTALLILRWIPWDLGTPWIQLLSLFPASLLATATALGAMVFAVCLDPRPTRTILAALVTAVLLLQLVVVAPRVMSAGGATKELQAAATAGSPGAGRTVTVMALNVGSSGVDADALLSLARARNIDIVALPELAPAGLEALEAAGLAAQFPFRALDVDWAGTGSAILSRFPLDSSARVPESSFYQSRAEAAIPGTSGGIHVTAVHIDSPRPGHTPLWREELGQLGELQRALPGSPPAILLGDFNAGHDHREFRELLATGFKDAAQAAGKGLAPTWPSGSSIPPFVALDHVLVTPDIEVMAFATITVPGTDHSAIVAELMLPR
jgi:endonuclease/exonuclease/phosphatase (EEP) superfamily protein YafD